MNLLFELILILAMAAIVVYICQLIKVPSIVGFLITGVLTGPSGIGIITSLDEVEILSEIGIVLLLFTIGLEFSLKQLFQIKKSVFLGGSIQVCLTIGAFYLIALSMGYRFNIALFIGMAFAISSTAIVLKLLQERAEMDTPFGQTTLGILIFQDILIVPFMLVLPVLAGVEFSSDTPTYLLVAKIVLALVGVVVLAKWGVPAILYQITKTQNRELFMLSVMVLGFAIAWVSHSIGLSLALGAFLAGLIISESEYSHQALGSILPFRDIFLSIFFISIGMLVNIAFVGSNILTIIIITVLVILLKGSLAGLAAKIVGHPLRSAILSGFALSQVGEFSFLLSKTGLSYNLLTPDMYQTFLAVTVLTMAVSPLILSSSKKVACSITNRPSQIVDEDSIDEEKGEYNPTLNDHMLIIGYGLNGKNLAKAAEKIKIPYSIIEMNPDTVKKEKAKGVSIYYGDATNEEVLIHGGVTHARVAVVAINDASATRRIVDLLHRINPSLKIIVRTRFVNEVKPLYELGACDVIPEEFETSIEIFTRVMRKYLLPQDTIQQFTREIRQEAYDILRSPSTKQPSIDAIKPLLKEIEITVLKIGENSPFIGKTLRETRPRNNFNVTIISIYHGEDLNSNPDGDSSIQEGDTLIVLGKPDDLMKFSDQLRG